MVRSVSSYPPSRRETGVPAAGGGNTGLFIRNADRFATFSERLANPENPVISPTQYKILPAVDSRVAQQQISCNEKGEHYGNYAVCGEEGGVEAGKVVWFDQGMLVEQ